MTDDELSGRLEQAMTRPVPPVDEARVAAVRAAALHAQTEPEAASAGDARPGSFTSRRALLLGTAAAAAGAIGGAVVTNAVDDDPSPTSGPPMEPVTWASTSTTPAGSTVAGRLINHTWGVELLLDATGLPVGTTYRVAYIPASGNSIDAGGFVGAELPIHCRCNGPLLRTDLRAIEIRATDGTPIQRADLT